MGPVCLPDPPVNAAGAAPATGIGALTPPSHQLTDQPGNRVRLGEGRAVGALVSQAGGSKHAGRDIMAGAQLDTGELRRCKRLERLHVPRSGAQHPGSGLQGLKRCPAPPVSSPLRGQAPASCRRGKAGAQVLAQPAPDPLAPRGVVADSRTAVWGGRAAGSVALREIRAPHGRPGGVQPGGWGVV